jgi:amidohydrolase
MLKQAHAISEELIEWRRDFHMHPEIGFELHRTSKIVADELEKMGYRVRRGVGKTGVVAEIGEGGKMVAIRADMDALPILEQNDHEYVSKNVGAMHACGHDSAHRNGSGRSITIGEGKTARTRAVSLPAL